MDLSQVSPPASGAIAAYWPLIVASLTTIGSIVSGVWAYFVTTRTKIIESEQERVSRHFELQCEQMRLEFERQKDFQQDLIDESKSLRQECQELRSSNQKLVSSVMERDATIKRQDEEIRLLKREIETLRHQVESMQVHIRKLETDSTERHGKKE